ncbi:DUF1707 SHOCT-like domain-containing protein [Actinomadura scrupuli]|uniref:DUF1707 SHOCT-like domain-containing protein n=1 Tax=Actinomadura scrupuli TaxID=559629 RepID=UPI003D962EF6
MTGEVSPQGRDDDQLRVSHEDRDRVVELLRVAAGDGRLTAEELDERLETALTARTYGDLAALAKDLPAAPGLVAGVHPPKPKDMIRIDCDSGSIDRVGRWLVPRRMEVRVTSGHVTLDFTEAVITQPSLQIDAIVRSGTLKLLTIPGVVVDADEVAVRAGSVKVRETWGAEVPVLLRVNVSGEVDSGSLTARPPRRSFVQWLLRRPSPRGPGG